MNKVVYSPTYGGYGLSEKGMKLFEELSGKEYEDRYDNRTPRHDKYLVQVVEILGKEASSDYADLKVSTIPGYQYRIHEYDGNETIECPEDDQGWVIIDCPEARDEIPEHFL